VSDLHDDLAAIFVDGRRHLFQPVDKAIIIHADLPRSGLAFLPT
jgi:hypothetical protein